MATIDVTLELARFMYRPLLCQELCYALGTSLALAVFLILIHRVYFHPLSKYPGPLLAKCTDLYAAYYGWTGNTHLEIQRCHQRYGKFVRYGPNRLLVNSAQAIQDIYSYRKNVQKSSSYLPMVPSKQGWCTFTAIDKLRHKHKRQLLSLQLGEREIQNFLPMITEQIDRFCSHLASGEPGRQDGTPKDIKKWSEYLTADIVSEYAFGKSLQTLDHSTNRFVLDLFRVYSWTMGVYEQMPSLAMLRLDTLLEFVSRWTASARALRNWKSYYASFVFNRQEQSQKGIFSRITKARDHFGKPFADEELWAEACFLLIAGYDTTSTTLAAIFFYLAHHRDAYNRLAREIRQTFTDVSEVTTGSKLSSCSYMYACITEAMRISPAVPGYPLREVLTGGAMVDGEFIPAGIDVGTCIYALHRDPSYFKDPELFLPERWIRADGSSSEQLDAQYSVHNPFSVGPRSCPGRQFAMTEITLTLARLVMTLDFRLSDEDLSAVRQNAFSSRGPRDSAVEYKLKTTITSISNGPDLVFRKRDR